MNTNYLNKEKKHISCLMQNSKLVRVKVKINDIVCGIYDRLA